MSEKVILQDRPTKKFTLPESGAEVEVYASVLAVDMVGVNVQKLAGGGDDNISDAIQLLAKLIKSWNVFASDKDEKPREINAESIGQLPMKDLIYLLDQMKDFISSEKKD